MTGGPNEERRPALPPHTRRPTPLPVVDSPRIAALKPGGTAQFWRTVEAEGTPLIEPDDDPAYRIVTFLWRDTGQRAVLLHANKLTDYNDLAPSLLRRLDGTDVWHLSYRLRADWRGTYALSPLTEAPVEPAVWRGPDRAAWQRLRAGAVTDPLNPRTFPNKFGGPDLSLAELPDAPSQPWWPAVPGTRAGMVAVARLNSEILGNARTIWTYTPPGYRDRGEPYPLLVLFDGDVWGRSLAIRHTLDNLIAAGQIPPMIALLVDSIDVRTRSVELACDHEFTRFLTDELLPWATGRWRLTADPARTIVAGQSLGGLTAVFAATRVPERFGNVLSQAGSFWWPGGGEFGAEPCWLTRHLAAAPRLPIAFDLEVGLLEWELLEPTRRLRDVLTAKGYPLTYREYHGGHDSACWRGGIADGLRALTARWSTVSSEVACV
ncbi:enterochelin esterase family protein [Herbihabitans rhizosphaerae]|uniref:Enterochelin esterase family protein n=1 Tax=Herbihabitans rhizosphaerae TaxID=1872711 RepID=A0A4Q7KYU3_9PSEU|nr:enterochelin esterase [Herbihabitans rhizosphaerae]RZS40852.1 enterochelin esterase family protein [Herbihabitans rhizosphaerae]